MVSEWTFLKSIWTKKNTVNNQTGTERLSGFVMFIYPFLMILYRLLFIFKDHSLIFNAC